MTLNREIYVIVTAHLISIVFSLGVNFWIYLKSRKTALLWLYMALQCVLLVWMFAKVMKTVSPNLTLRWFFVVMQYFGACFLGSTFFLFARTLFNGKRFSMGWFWSMTIPSCLFFLAVVTNPLHKLFYSRFDFVGDDFGVLFYVYAAYSYACILAGLVLCGLSWKRNAVQQRRASSILVLGTIIPFIFNILYITRTYKLVFGHRPLYDYTPICYSISMILFAIAIFRYRLLDYSHVMSTDLFNLSPVGLALANPEGRTQVNGAWQAIFQDHPEQVEEQLKRCMSDDDGIRSKHMMNGRTYFMFHFPIRAQLKGYFCIMIWDVTKVHELMSRLRQENAVLLAANTKLETQNATIEQAVIRRTQNMAARSLHDILGHGLVLAVSLMDTSALMLQDGLREGAALKIHAALSALKQGQAELEKAVLKQSICESSLPHLVNRLKAVSERFSHVGVSVLTTIDKSLNERMSQDTHDSLYLICIEAVTNAVKHGNAQVIDILFKRIGDFFHLYVIDDGIGCNQIKLGFGLTNMQREVQRTGGQMTAMPGDEGGFMLKVSMPLGAIGT